ncbi:MAG TPA: alpha/beta fold hydrolase [Hyphomicrobiaceae bacterium]
MPWIEANGAALRYDIAGTGPRTIVLVHEMGGTLESWMDVVPLLTAGGYRVLSYDTRGAGLSEKARSPLSIDTMADDAAGLLDALGIAGKVAIAGIAVGGAIAIRFAARHSARTAALVVMSPATGIAPERRPAALAMVDAIERDGMRPGMDASLGPTYPSELRADDTRFRTVRAQRLGNDPASYAAVYRMLASLDMSADLASIACPTLVLAGRHDGLRPPSLVESVAHAIPGSRFAVLDTAHFMAWQTPEAVADALTDFLAAVSW